MASEMLVLENFIGGKFVPCTYHIDSYDPSTGNVYCKVPDSGKEEVDMAVKAASKAFERRGSGCIELYTLVVVE